MRANIPLSGAADTWLAALFRETGSAALERLRGATLLGERAVLGGFRIPSTVSAGGGCRLFEAIDGAVALNLSRASDRELLPALFETRTAGDIRVEIGARDANRLVERGRLLGLAIAAENEVDTAEPAVRRMVATAAVSRVRPRPRVIDLSALWAGPLAAHLLHLCGAEVIKVESSSRFDRMRSGDPAFFALLNQDKASVVVDLRDREDRAALVALIAGSDIVIEAARPRGLAQLGVDADAIVRATPGLTWVTITGHGVCDEAATWIGFGDDCGVAAGLSAAKRLASGRGGFVGDAIADPLTGIRAAGVAWRGWLSGTGGRYGVSMRAVVAEAMAIDIDRLDHDLSGWAAAEGLPFPAVQRRYVGPLAPLGHHTRACLTC